MIDRSIGCDERVDSKDAKASLSYIVPNDILIGIRDHVTLAATYQIEIM